jgi:hypothetical protein
VEYDIAIKGQSCISTQTVPTLLTLVLGVAQPCARLRIFGTTLGGWTDYICLLAIPAS